MESINMHYHTREDISEMARNGCMVVVPLAATEQHGPHLPVYTDSLICEYVVTESVRQAAQSIPILMAPVMPIGCSQHHLAFGGTLSLTSMTYLQMIRDIGESLVLSGFRKIVFINAHGGNEAIISQTVSDLVVKYPIWVASTFYSSVALEAIKKLDQAYVDNGIIPGHAGDFETSLIMALNPELVRTERLATTHPTKEWLNRGRLGGFVGKHKELTGFDGYTDAPYKATAEMGHRYLDAITNKLAEWLVNINRTMTPL